MDPKAMAQLIKLADAGSGIAQRRLALAKAAAEAMQEPAAVIAAGAAGALAGPAVAAVAADSPPPGSAAGAAAGADDAHGAADGAGETTAGAGGAAGPAAGAVGAVDREALPKGDAPPAPGSAAGAGDAAGAAAGAAEDAPAAEPPWWRLHEVAAGAADAAAAGTAAGLATDPEDDSMAIDMILQRLEGPDTRSPEEVATHEAWTTRQLELEANHRQLEALRRQEQDAAGAAEGQRAADEAASEAEAWRLFRLDAGAAWADVPHGTAFLQEFEAHGLRAFPHLQEPKAAFDRRMQNKRPLAESASPQAGADAPQEGPTVSGETVASPDFVQVATQPGASPTGAEQLQEAPPVKATPAQSLQFKPEPAPAFTAPPPPKMLGSSTDAVPSKPMPKLHKVQPCTYTDVRYAAGAVPRTDAEAVAREQAARLEAAQQAARLAAAQAPAGNKPTPPPAQFTSDEVAAFTMGQQSMAGRIANPWAQPAAHGAGKGKGKAKPADPFLGMVAEGTPKGKGKGKKGPRDPDPCSRWEDSSSAARSRLRRAGMRGTARTQSASAPCSSGSSLLTSRPSSWPRTSPPSAPQPRMPLSSLRRLRKPRPPPLLLVQFPPRWGRPLVLLGRRVPPS